MQAGSNAWDVGGSEVLEGPWGVVTRYQESLTVPAQVILRSLRQIVPANHNEGGLLEPALMFYFFLNVTDARHQARRRRSSASAPNAPRSAADGSGTTFNT